MGSYFIDVSSLKKGGVKDAAFSGTIEAPDYYGIVGNAVKTSFNGSVFFDGEVYALEGTGRAEYMALCSRCLKETAVSFDFTLDEAYAKSGSDIKSPGGEYNNDVTRLSDNKIDVSEAVYECVISEAPRKPLCGEYCKGLCRRCGRDLNEGPCDCGEHNFYDIYI